MKSLKQLYSELQQREDFKILQTLKGVELK